MVFTEIKKRNSNTYYYRASSIRRGKKVSKKRIYMGKNLDKKNLILKEDSADIEIYKLRRNLKGDFEEIKKKLVPLLKDKGVKKAGIFGSYARGEQRKNSDVDILVKLNSKINGFAFFGLQDEISQKIGKKIDLVTYGGLSPYMKKDILKEEVKII